MRRGIAFGPELSPAEQTSNTTQEDRGLLFACYQADISAAFQFIQKSKNSNFLASHHPFTKLHRLVQ
jgi:deferrochelatase/peroxidase EfeB